MRAYSMRYSIAITDVGNPRPVTYERSYEIYRNRRIPLAGPYTQIQHWMSQITTPLSMADNKHFSLV